MGISNFTLTKIFGAIYDNLLGAKIERIINISNNDFILSIFKDGKSQNLMISLDPSLPILLLAPSFKVDSINVASYQCNMLKKYFEHGTIVSLEKIKDDRIIIINIKKWSQSYQLLSSKLIFELFPLSPNIIITDDDYKILDAFKHSESLDSKHPIYKGLTYSFPNTTPKYFNAHTPISDMMGKINKSELRYLQSLSEDDYYQELKKMIEEKDYYLYKNEISSLKINPEAKKVKLEDLYEILLKKKTEENKQNKYQHIFKLVEQKIKSNEKKIKNLELDKEKFLNYNHYQEYGNLLFLGEDIYHKGDTSITIENIIISLDSKLNLKENAQKYFKLYKKSKTGLVQIELQKENAKKELDYFKQIASQLLFASNNDLQEIILDLSENHYLKEQKNNSKKKKQPGNKRYTPHYIKLENGIKIGYGLSSFQNEELTFSIAKKDDIYLHIKDFHGPHVILFTPSPSDDELLFAAEVALYFANKSLGEVYYCKRGNVKKVPGQRGLTTLTSYHTLTIKQIRKKTLSLLKRY